MFPLEHVGETPTTSQFFIHPTSSLSPDRLPGLGSLPDPVAILVAEVAEAGRMGGGVFWPLKGGVSPHICLCFFWDHPSLYQLPGVWWRPGGLEQG